MLGIIRHGKQRYFTYVFQEFARGFRPKVKIPQVLVSSTAGGTEFEMAAARSSRVSGPTNPGDRMERELCKKRNAVVAFVA